MAGQLIVAVAGTRDRTIDDVADFCALLDTRGVPLSFLLTPRLGGGHRLLEDAAVTEWLRSRRGNGDAIVLHGYDQSAATKRRPEFATLAAHEANLRLMAADRVLEQTGLRTRLFAPPGWVASSGTLTVLPRNGFRLLATSGAITDLMRRTTVRARVLGIGAGFLTEPWWCRTLVLSAERIARRDGIVRLSISAKQLRQSGPRQAMLDAIDLALLHGAIPTVYRWLPDQNWVASSGASTRNSALPISA